MTYAIDNSGQSLHTVTVNLDFATTVTGTIGYTLAGGLANQGGLTGSATLTITGQQPQGGQIREQTSFTLKLEVVEDNQ